MHKTHLVITAFVCLILSGLIPAATAAADTPPSPLVSEAAQLATQFSKGDFKSCQSQFTARMQKLLPPAKMAAAWQSLIAQVGAFQGTGESTVQASGPYQVVFLKSKFKKGNMWMQMAIDKTGKITGLFFSKASN